MAPTKKTPKPASAPGAAPRRPRKQKLPTENDIARRAYELYVQRGGEHGRDLDDWLLARRELFDAEG
jgi:hypothetical protein